MRRLDSVSGPEQSAVMNINPVVSAETAYRLKEDMENENPQASFVRPEPVTYNLAS